MKFRIFLICFFCAYTFAIAQKGFRIGPSASFVSSRLIVNDSIANNFNFRFKSGFNVGLNMHYGITSNFSISLGLLATSKGYRLFNDTNKNGNILKHNQTHFEIPLHFIFKQRLNSLSYIRENIGISVSHMISTDKKDLKNNNGSFRISETTKNKTYPMLSVGLEACNEGKNGNLFTFGVFYRQAFNKNTNLNIFNNQTATKQRFDLTYRGSYIGISVSYLFSLKGLKKKDEFFY